MKIRNGFVSNSSTTSFCIAKQYMSPNQITEFIELNDKWEEESEDHYINSGELYFHGVISQHNTEILAWLKKNRLDKYASFA